MWIDYWLKFPDEQTFLDAVPNDWFFEDSNGRHVAVGTENRALDIIGIIFNDATYDSNGNVVIEEVQLPGYHANLRLSGVELPASFEEYSIPEPNHPKRKFA